MKYKLTIISFFVFCAISQLTAVAQERRWLSYEPAHGRTLHGRDHERPIYKQNGGMRHLVRLTEALSPNFAHFRQIS